MANAMLYGFYHLKDIANQRAITVNRDLLISAVQQSAAEHNRQIQMLTGLFARRTTDYKVRFKSASNNRLQAMDEDGRALPVKTAAYDVAFPIQMGGSAWGTNFVTQAKRTVQDVNDDTSNMFIGDINWVRDHIFGGLFYNGSGWTNTDKQYGDLTILGLANADTTLYPRSGGVPATDNHYLAQAGDIVDATNPFSVILPELTEHPTNSGNIIAFVPSANVAKTKALAAFDPISDANLIAGANSDRVVGTPGVEFPGTLFGRVNNMWAVEWPALPSDYIVALDVNGDPPLAMREEPEAELQGFRAQGTREDYPFFEDQWFRRAGFGAWNRVGAVVYRVNNGTYAIPTSYGSPMY